MMSIAKIWDFFYLFSSYSSSGPFESSLHENFSKIIFFWIVTTHEIAHFSEIHSSVHYA